MIHRLVAAEARPNYRLWVRFEDGVEGEVDLSDVAGLRRIPAVERDSKRVR